MRLQQLFDTYHDHAQFYWIYIREAHPSDGMRPARHVEIAQPRTFEQRTDIATTCSANLKLTIPVLIDDMEDKVSRAYNAWPDRLFILGPDGAVAYRGNRGPRGFDVDDLERALRTMLKL